MINDFVILDECNRVVSKLKDILYKYKYFGIELINIINKKYILKINL